MSAHTPGPWKVIAKKFWSASIGIVAAKKLATPVAWASRLCNGGDAEAIANANLIAAAPELLDLVRDLRNAHDGAVNVSDDPFPDDLDRSREWLERIRAAIAKAEGKS